MPNAALLTSLRVAHKKNSCLLLATVPTLDWHLTKRIVDIYKKKTKIMYNIHTLLFTVQKLRTFTFYAIHIVLLK